MVDSCYSVLAARGVNAWSVFYNQPYCRHVVGVLFFKQVDSSEPKTSTPSGILMSKKKSVSVHQIEERKIQALNSLAKELKEMREL